MMNVLDMQSLPNIHDSNIILCIQPHPDDMDVSFGATIAKLASAGKTIIYLTVTDGSAGTFAPSDKKALAIKRRNEQQTAGEWLGVSQYLWLDYDDAKYIPEENLQNDILQAIRTYKPDTVLTVDPWLPYESHPAHRTTGFAAAAATLFSNFGNIGLISNDSELHQVQAIGFTFTAKPNTYVDVSTTWDLKFKAIRSHQSQFPSDGWSFYETYFNAKGAEYGQILHCEKAEAVKMLAPIHLHCNVDIDRL